MHDPFQKGEVLSYTLEHELDVAIALAEQAGNILLNYFSPNAEVAIEWKGKNNLVTAADREAS